MVKIHAKNSMIKKNVRCAVLAFLVLLSFLGVFLKLKYDALMAACVNVRILEEFAGTDSSMPKKDYRYDLALHVSVLRIDQIASGFLGGVAWRFAVNKDDLIEGRLKEARAKIAHRNMILDPSVLAKDPGEKIKIIIK